MQADRYEAVIHSVKPIIARVVILHAKMIFMQHFRIGLKLGDPVVGCGYVA